MIRTFTGIVAGSAALCLSACTTAELEAISQGLAQASYDMQYSPYGSTGYGGATPMVWGRQITTPRNGSATMSA